MIEVTRTCSITKKESKMKINTTQRKIDQWDTWARAYGTPLIQDYFNECSIAEREFILTGITIDTWKRLDDLWNEE
jgi:hypothetical protein